MQQTSGKIVAVALGAIVSFGLAGEAVAAAPAWCKAYVPPASDLRLEELSSPDPVRSLEAYLQATCAPSPQVEANRAQIEASRQAWSKKLFLTEADWADVVAFFAQQGADRYSDRVVLHGYDSVDAADARSRPWSAFDPIDQWAMIASGFGASGDLALDPHYFADALGPKLSELGRAAYVKRCIGASDNQPVTWAMCQGDVARLDFARIAAEVRATSSYAGTDKMRIRLALDQLRGALPGHAAKVKALIAKDPGYAKLFELAASVREDWAARAKADGPLLELVAAMDDARTTNSRKAFAGCEDKTWPAWKAAVGAIPATAFEGLRDDFANGQRFDQLAMGPLLSNPSVYLASVALATCVTASQDAGGRADLLVRLLASGTRRWPGFRGPRTGTETAAMTAGIVLDDRGAKLEYPAVDRQFGGTGEVSLTLGAVGSGVIASLKPAGKTVTVSFKKQMVKQVQCAERKTTNRINQITSGGDIIYNTTCVRNETVVVDKAAPPQQVNPRYLDGVKPGMDVSISEGVVVWARAKPGSASPTMVFGVALK
jgi:hypothetical protein